MSLTYYCICFSQNFVNKFSEFVVRIALFPLKFKSIVEDENTKEIIIVVSHVNNITTRCIGFPITFSIHIYTRRLSVTGYTCQLTLNKSSDYKGVRQRICTTTRIVAHAHIPHRSAVCLHWFCHAICLCFAICDPTRFTLQ